MKILEKTELPLYNVKDHVPRGYHLCDINTFNSAMKSIFPLILFLFLVKALFAQLAIINDPDGYVNIREGRSKDAKITGRLFDGDFFLATPGEEPGGDWWEVYYSADPGELENYKLAWYRKNNLTDGKVLYLQGYVYKSRILPVDSLASVARGTIRRTKNTVSLTNDSVRFFMRTTNFVQKNHLIEKDSGGFVTAIDHRRPMGTDGDLPRTEITEISLTIQGMPVEFTRKHYRDLYEPNLETVNLVTDRRGGLILTMPFNSDGAGAYCAAWLIRDRKMVRRYVDSL